MTALSTKYISVHLSFDREPVLAMALWQWHFHLSHHTILGQVSCLGNEMILIIFIQNRALESSTQPFFSPSPSKTENEGRSYIKRFAQRIFCRNFAVQHRDLNSNNWIIIHNWQICEYLYFAALRISSHIST